MQASGFRNLVLRAQAGDAEAMERLIRLADNYLSSLARGYVTATADDSVSDLKQEVRLQFWLKLGQFEGGPSDEATLVAFRAWLRKVVHRLAIRRQRDRNRQRRKPLRPIVSLDDHPNAPDGNILDPAATDATPRTAAAVNELTSKLHAALHAVEAIDRRIIELRFNDGQSLRTIAAGLGLNYDEVRSRFHRTLAQLEKLLPN